MASAVQRGQMYPLVQQSQRFARRELDCAESGLRVSGKSPSHSVKAGGEKTPSKKRPHARPLEGDSQFGRSKQVPNVGNDDMVAPRLIADTETWHKPSSRRRPGRLRSFDDPEYRLGARRRCPDDRLVGGYWPEAGTVGGPSRVSAAERRCAAWPAGRSSDRARLVHLNVFGLLLVSLFLAQQRPEGALAAAQRLTELEVRKPYLRRLRREERERPLLSFD